MDTPGVKLTWTGSATSTLPILMSGLRLSPPGHDSLPIDGMQRTYVYEQKILVPSYLIALAGGELVFAVSRLVFAIFRLLVADYFRCTQPLGKRTGVWAEPAMIEAAKWEFEQDMERYGSIRPNLRSAITDSGRTTDISRPQSQLPPLTSGDATTFSFFPLPSRMEGWRTHVSLLSRPLSSSAIDPRSVHHFPVFVHFRNSYFSPSPPFSPSNPYTRR